METSSTQIGTATESCLRFLPEANGLPIKSLNGQRILANANDVFKKYISGSLLIRGLNNPAQPTPAILASGKEICDDATFIKIFGDFKEPLENLCLTQDQICEFCSLYPGFLAKYDATFFLFRRDEEKPAKGDNLFVACVTASFGGLMVREEPYQDDFIWYGNRGLRVFVPKTA